VIETRPPTKDGSDAIADDVRQRPAFDPEFVAAEDDGHVRHKAWSTEVATKVTNPFGNVGGFRRRSRLRRRLSSLAQGPLKAERMGDEQAASAI